MILWSSVILRNYRVRGSSNPTNSLSKYLCFHAGAAKASIPPKHAGIGDIPHISWKYELWSEDWLSHFRAFGHPSVNPTKHNESECFPGQNPPKAPFWWDFDILTKYAELAKFSWISQHVWNQLDSQIPSNCVTCKRWHYVGPRWP